MNILKKILCFIIYILLLYNSIYKKIRTSVGLNANGLENYRVFAVKSKQKIKMHFLFENIQLF